VKYARTTLIGSLMVRRGDADAMLCGTIAEHSLHLGYVANVIGLRKGVNSCRDEHAHPAETHAVHLRYLREPDPTAAQLAEITMLAATKSSGSASSQDRDAVAFQFGSSRNPSAQKMSAAREILEQKHAS